ncbi:hypothetical protein SteCoe_32120 [Stentor coeruleus]|uniref:Tetratricopeptide repeat protein n=1 Tax=Stentor coeruleus TaxID=5963 RepID=A0A1R2AZR6_9CILI|nr:hypothetical protein SteCoe_32120 [Stentor coeruleus]
MKASHELTLQNIESYTEHYIEKFFPKLYPKSTSFPEDFSLEDHENLKYLVKTLNNLALQSHFSNKKSYSFLRKANKLSIILWKKTKKVVGGQELLKASAKLRSLTLNNLACYFKGCDKLLAALEYLEKAVKIEEKGSAEDYEIATTLLNLTVIKSKLGNHEEAFNKSLEAVRILEKADEEKEMPEALATSYYNHAVELEYLQRINEAKLFYEKAYNLSKRKFGESNESTQNFLEKLVQFNFTHASCDLSITSLPSTLNKSQKSSKKSVTEEKKLDILYQGYKSFSGIRFKFFFLDKPSKSAIKILAFPENKYPVYRMMLEYNRIYLICKNKDYKEFKTLDKNQTTNCMLELLNYLFIEKGSLIIVSDESRARPTSASYQTEVNKSRTGIYPKPKQ